MTPAQTSLGTQTPEHAAALRQRESRFYFRIHILLFVAGVFFFLTAIGWLVWRLSQGGLFEMAIVPVISAVLLSMLLVAGRSLLTIALDGVEEEVHFTPKNVARLETKPVSVARFLTDRGENIGPMSRRTFEG